MFHKRRSGRRTGVRLGPAILFGIKLLALRYLAAEGGGCLRGLRVDHQTRHAGVQPVNDAHIASGLSQSFRRAAGTPSSLESRRACPPPRGCIFVEYHSLPSSTSALSLSTPAMVLPSLISPLMTIS